MCCVCLVSSFGRFHFSLLVNMEFPAPYPSIMLCNPAIYRHSSHSLPHRSCFPNPSNHLQNNRRLKLGGSRGVQEQPSHPYVTHRPKASSNRHVFQAKATSGSPDITLIRRWKNSKQRKAIEEAIAYENDTNFFQPLLSDPIQAQNASQGSPNTTSSHFSDDYASDISLCYKLRIKSNDTESLIREHQSPVCESPSTTSHYHHKSQSFALQIVDSTTSFSEQYPSKQQKAFDPQPPLKVLSLPRRSDESEDIETMSDLPVSVRRKPRCLRKSPPQSSPRQSLPDNPSPTSNSPSSTALRLFPTSPTSSIKSNESIRNQYNRAGELSPISPTFKSTIRLSDPELPLISVFEDDDENTSLVDYFRFSWKSSKSQMKSHTRNKKLFSAKLMKGLCCF